MGTRSTGNPLKGLQNQKENSPWTSAKCIQPIALNRFYNWASGDKSACYFPSRLLFNAVTSWILEETFLSPKISKRLIYYYYKD